MIEKKKEGKNKMKRFASVIKLKEGADKEEYKRRHDRVWPELSDLMSRRGMKNYSIWLYENLLFSYYETEDDGIRDITSEEDLELEKRWEAYMSDLIEHVKDLDTGRDVELRQMFLHE